MVELLDGLERHDLVGQLGYYIGAQPPVTEILSGPPEYRGSVAFGRACGEGGDPSPTSGPRPR